MGENAKVVNAAKVVCLNFMGYNVVGLLVTSTDIIVIGILQSLLQADLGDLLFRALDYCV